MPSLSIVVPVYNAANLHLLATALLEAAPEDTELLLIDDFSPMHATYPLQELQHARIRYYRLEKNIGQDKATAWGITKATGEYIITIDDDLEFPASEIQELIKLTANNTIHLGYGLPKQGKKSIFRVTTRHFYYLLIQQLNYPVFSSFRIIHNSLLPAIEATYDDPHFCLDKLLLTQTSNIGHTLVDYHPKSNSRYSKYRLFRKFLLFFCYHPKK